MAALRQRCMFLLAKEWAAKQLTLGPNCSSTVSHIVASADASLLSANTSHWSPQHLAGSANQYRHYGGFQQVISQRFCAPQLNRVPFSASSSIGSAARDFCSKVPKQDTVTSSGGQPGSAQGSRTLHGSTAVTAGAAEPRSTSDSSSSSTSSKAAGGTPAGGDTGGARSDVPPGVAAAAEVTGKTAARATKAATKGMSRVLKLIHQTPVLHSAHLQLSSIWQSHSTAITTVAAAAATAGLYKIIHTAAGTVVDVSSMEAMWGCAAAAASVVGGTGLYVRSGLVVDPERVYQVAMRKLTRHAGLQEVMGTPLTGSPMRVQLITRGSYFMPDSLMPVRRAPRIHMLFPLSGPLKSGVVSLEAKKVPSRKYAFRNLSVELPSKGLTAAAAAARAAAAEAGQQTTGAAAGSSWPAAAAQDSSNSSSRSGISSGVGGGVDLGADQQVEAARVYVVGSLQHDYAFGTDPSSTGGPAATDSGSHDAAVGTSSSSGSKQVLPSSHSARVLLEQLKHPLMLALQQNIGLSETEDELADVQGYDATALDPDQLTIWDRTKESVAAVFRGGVYYAKVAGCKVVGFVRRLLATARKAAKKREATAAAAAKVAAAAEKAKAKPEPLVQTFDAVVAAETLPKAGSVVDPAAASSAAAVGVLEEATAAPAAPLAAAEREAAKPAQAHDLQNAQAAAAERVPTKAGQMYDLHNAQTTAAKVAVQKAADEKAVNRGSAASGSGSSSSQGSTESTGDAVHKQ